MGMPPKLKNSVIAAIPAGAIAIAAALITGPTGNDGLEGVRYLGHEMGQVKCTLLEFKVDK